MNLEELNCPALIFDNKAEKIKRLWMIEEGFELDMSSDIEEGNLNGDALRKLTKRYKEAEFEYKKRVIAGKYRLCRIRLFENDEYADCGFNEAFTVDDPDIGFPQNEEFAHYEGCEQCPILNNFKTTHPEIIEKWVEETVFWR